MISPVFFIILAGINHSPVLEKILIIQTAFIGDVILSTAIAEKLHLHYPKAEIHYLVKKGHESLFEGHPYIHRIWTFDKTRKMRSLWKLIKEIRAEKYNLVVNVHRFFSSGLISVFSGADEIAGFNKNPWSLLFTHVARHIVSKQTHEVVRNQGLIAEFTDTEPVRPRLYVAKDAIDFILIRRPYIVFAPGSVWYTKQWPEEHWSELAARLDKRFTIYLIGGPADVRTCEMVKKQCTHHLVFNLAGRLTLLESGRLMQGASMCYVNDSAPMHLASAFNAPVTAIYCSTVPYFGFTPLSDKSYIVQTDHELECRPCGLHGKRECPKGHFMCSDINLKRFTLPDVSDLLF